MGFSVWTLPSTADPPFGAPPDITIDLPPPPSVNRTRKIDWRNNHVLRKWIEHADALVLSGPKVTGRRIPRFELFVVVSERCRNDLDNSLKTLIDYLRRIEIIEDDGPAHMRRVTIEWGLAPEGARITVRPIA
jgi:Holliday junction resolvase RusA-like endonuclease